MTEESGRSRPMARKVGPVLSKMRVTGIKKIHLNLAIGPSCWFVVNFFIGLFLALWPDNDYGPMTSKPDNDTRVYVVKIKTEDP